jgi:uncharacterized protein (UPF0297 family)
MNRNVNRCHIKKRILLVLITISMGHLSVAQADEAQQLLLNVEKLAQLKKILQNMYEGYQVLEKGYNTIRDISEGNFSLHQHFLDALLEVSPAVRNYSRIAEIGKRQVALVQHCRKALDHFKHQPTLNKEEIAYLDQVYQNLVRKSIRNLDNLLLIVSSGQLRMDDGERLAAIDRIHKEITEQGAFLNHINNTTALLVTQRKREQAEGGQLKKWYRLP